MDIAFDTELCKDRHSIERVFKPRHDAVVISFEQVVLGFPGTVVVPNDIGVRLFVDTNKTGLLLHADIARNQFIVTDHGQFVIEIHKFRHIVSHEVVVGHRRGRDVDATPLTHLAGVSSRGVDHMLADNVTVISADTPLARRQLLHVRCSAMANHGCTKLTRAFGQRHGHAGRINVTIVRGV